MDHMAFYAARTCAVQFDSSALCIFSKGAYMRRS
jgi:hypothetical protein